MAGLNIRYDNDGAWDWGDPNAEGPEVLTKMVDQYADAGAKFIVRGYQEGSFLSQSQTPRFHGFWHSFDRIWAARWRRTQAGHLILRRRATHGRFLEQIVRRTLDKFVVRVQHWLLPAWRFPRGTGARSFDGRLWAPHAGPRSKRTNRLHALPVGKRLSCSIFPA